MYTLVTITSPTYATIHPLEDDTIIFLQAKMVHMDPTGKRQDSHSLLTCVAGSAASASARGQTASSTLRTVSFDRGGKQTIISLGGDTDLSLKLHISLQSRLKSSGISCPLGEEAF